MAKFKLNFIIVLTVISVLLVSVNVYADTDLQNERAQALVNLKIMQGYEDGSLRLQNKIKRSEFVTLVVKMLGYDKDTDVNNITVDFNDIKKSHWAYSYARLSVKYKLIVGTPDKKFSPDSYITYAEALTILIRSLGYEGTLQGSWPDNVLNKAIQLGLNKNLDELQNSHQITRGEMSVIVYNSLTVNLNQ